MTLPNVTIEQTNGNLGRIEPQTDGTTLLVCTGSTVGSITAGTVAGPFLTLAEVETAGITAAYDTANDLLAHQHVKDFYANAPAGTELYILLLAATVTMTQALDKTLNHVAKAVRDTGDKVRLIGIGRIPNEADTYTNQFETDLSTAVAKAQELRNYLFEAPYHTPVQIVIEGRNWQGNAGSSKDNHLFAANRVSIVISQDSVVAAKDAAFAKYAHVGLAVGVLARDQVQRNIGRVKSGPIAVDAPSLSNGTLIAATDAATLEALNAKGYIFLRRHSGLEGVYFNDDHTCAPLTDDYCKIAHGRVMDKASRIARTVYLQELNDDIELDAATGKLPVSVCKNFQAIINTAIDARMTSRGEISAVTSYVNPAQDVAATDLVEVELNIRKRGTGRYYNAKLAFARFEA
jgi:hypothetical protein